MSNQTIQAISQPITVTVCEDACEPDAEYISKFQEAIKAIVGKWKIEIVCALVKGPRRFGDLRRALPNITQHMLTAKLRELADSGLVQRTSYGGEKLPHVEYELTEAAFGLYPVVSAMVEWSDRYGIAR